MIFRLKWLFLLLVPILLLALAWLGIPWSYATEAQWLQSMQVLPKESEMAKILELVRHQLNEPWLFRISLGHSLSEFPRSVSHILWETVPFTFLWVLLQLVMGFVGSAALGWLLIKARWYPHSFLMHWVRIPPVLWVALFSFVSLRALQWVAFFAFMSFFLGGLLSRFEFEKVQPYAQFARHLGMGNQWFVRPLVQQFLLSYRAKWPWLWTHSLFTVLAVELLQKSGTGHWLYQSLVGMDFAVHRIWLPVLFLISTIPILAATPSITLRKKQRLHWRRALLLSFLFLMGGVVFDSSFTWWMIGFLTILPWVLLLPSMGHRPLGFAWVIPMWFFWPQLVHNPAWFFLGLLLILPFQGLSIVLSLFFFQSYFSMTGQIPISLVGAIMALVLLVPQEELP